VRRFRNIQCQIETTPSRLKTELEELALKKTEVQKGAPHIGGLAYQLGKRSILEGEAQYKADKLSIPK
jgi:hypothetical protein